MKYKKKAKKKKNDFNDLVYCFKGPNISPINFIRSRDPLHIFNEIINGKSMVKSKR